MSAALHLELVDNTMRLVLGGDAAEAAHQREQAEIARTGSETAQASAETARDQAADLVAPENVFIDVALATAEAAVATGTAFKLVTTATGIAEIRLRTSGGSSLLYTELTRLHVERAFGKVPAVANNPATNQAPAINAALASSDVRQIVLPGWDIGIASGIDIPDGKALIGQGRDRTVLKALADFETSGGGGDVNPAMIDGPGNGGTCTVRGLTVDAQERGLGNGDTGRVNGIRMFWTRRFLIEDVGAKGCTKYGIWAVGGDNDVNAKWSSGTVRTSLVENCEVAYEATATDGLLWDDCHARKAGGAVPALSFYHVLTGARNTILRASSGIGAANAGIDPQADVDGGDLGDFLIEGTHIALTSAGAAFAVASGQPHRVGSIRIKGSRFLSPNGLAASFLATDRITASASVFAGASGVFIDGCNGEFTGCQMLATRDVGSGTAAVALAVNALADYAEPIAVRGGRIIAIGNADSVALQGAALLDISPDTYVSPSPIAMPIGTASGIANTNHTTISDVGSGYHFVIKSTGSDGTYDAGAHGTTALTGDFLIEIAPHSIGDFVVGVSADANDSAGASDIVGIAFDATGLVYTANLNTFTIIDSWSPGRRFWLRRLGNQMYLLTGRSAAYARRLAVIEVNGTVEADCSLKNTSTAVLLRVTQ